MEKIRRKVRIRSRFHAERQPQPDLTWPLFPISPVVLELSALASHSLLIRLPFRHRRLALALLEVLQCSETAGVVVMEWQGCVRCGVMGRMIDQQPMERHDGSRSEQRERIRE